MTQEVRIKPRIEIESVWASPREGMSLDELVLRLEKLGNKVVEIDRKNNRVRIAHGKE